MSPKTQTAVAASSAFKAEGSLVGACGPALRLDPGCPSGRPEWYDEVRREVRREVPRAPRDRKRVGPPLSPATTSGFFVALLPAPMRAHRSTIHEPDSGARLRAHPAQSRA